MPEDNFKIEEDDIEDVYDENLIDPIIKNKDVMNENPIFSFFRSEIEKRNKRS